MEDESAIWTFDVNLKHKNNSQIQVHTQAEEYVQILWDLAETVVSNMGRRIVEIHEKFSKSDAASFKHPV